MAVFYTSKVLIHDLQLTGRFPEFYYLPKQSLAMCLFLPHMLQLPLDLEYLPLSLLLKSDAFQLLAEF